MLSFSFLLALSLAQRVMMAFVLGVNEPWRAAAAALCGALADALPALALFLFWPKRGTLRPLLSVYTAALSVFLTLDGAYFLVVRNRIDRLLLKNIEPASVLAHLNSQYLIYALLAAAACAVLCLAALRVSAGDSQRPRLRRGPALFWTSAAALAALLFVPALPESVSSTGFVNFSINRGFSMIRVPSLVSLAKAFGGSSSAVFSGERLEFTKTELEALREMGLEKEPSSSARGPRLGLRRIVIIAAESLSRNYIRRWNPRIPAGTTPFLDELADKHPSVENYWSGAMPTEEAIYSILLSRPLYDADSVAAGRLSPLFSELRKAGFRSFILRGHTHFFQDAVSLYPRLYMPDAFLGAEEMSAGRPPFDFEWGYRDRVVLEETVRLLERERAGPVIALVSLMDMHPPYNSDVPEEELPPSVAASESRLLRSIHSTDRALAYFFGELEKRGLFDGETLVAVTADHRPAYGETGSFMDSEDYMNWRIPLIFALKDGKKSLQFGRGISGSHIDLAPTLLGLLGLPAPEGYWGRSLLEPGRKGTGIGSADDFILAQSPAGYFWILYGDAAKPPSADEPVKVRAFKKWVHNRLLGTTGRVPRQIFDEKKKRWIRHSL